MVRPLQMHDSDDRFVPPRLKVYHWLALGMGGAGKIKASSTCRKRGRGQARGVALQKATRGGQRVPIVIPEGMTRPVEGMAAAFRTELGIICHQYTSPTASTWASVSDADREHLFQRVTAKFELDLTNHEVKDAVVDIFRTSQKE